jgi:hypothetical protein
MIRTERTNLYQLHEYVTDSGEFDYAEYTKQQEIANNAKLSHTWAFKENIEAISKYIKRRINPQMGICHGTRRGDEQRWFMEYLPSCNVIGTEIASTATQFPNTIQWDFHNVKPEWIASFDFVYSNSFDHTYDPDKCLNAWMSCLKTDGLCIIECAEYYGDACCDSPADAFRFDLRLFPYMVLAVSNGRYGVTDIVPVPMTRQGMKYRMFFVIEHFNHWRDHGEN